MKTLKETTDLTVRELAEMFGKGSTTVQYHLNKTKADQPVKTSKNRKPVKNHAQS